MGPGVDWEEVIMETWGWDVVTVYKGAMCICQASGSRMGCTITLVFCIEPNLLGEEEKLAS